MCALHYLPVPHVPRIDPRHVAPGGEVTLKWNVVNADSVSIEPGVGKIESKGEKKATVAETTTFVLRGEGPEGPVERKISVVAK